MMRRTTPPNRRLESGELEGDARGPPIFGPTLRPPAIMTSVASSPEHRCNRRLNSRAAYPLFIRHLTARRRTQGIVRNVQTAPVFSPFFVRHFHWPTRENSGDKFTVKKTEKTVRTVVMYCRPPTQDEPLSWSCQRIPSSPRNGRRVGARRCLALPPHRHRRHVGAQRAAPTAERHTNRLTPPHPVDRCYAPVSSAASLWDACVRRDCR